MQKSQKIQTTIKIGVEAFIDECTRHGLRQVVCSPGSRNAAIVIALEAHPLIETIVIHDERSAAFYALGMIEATNRPVGVVCTSGSAMLNYYPAVAEAFYRCLPLVVMSADRPEEWVNHGDGQTIVQKGAYKNHIRGEAIIPEYEDGTVSQKVNEVFVSGLETWKGPMHFNLPISEPMYETVEKDWRPQEEVLHLSPELDLDQESQERLKNEWNRFGKKMILCGQMPNDGKFTNLLKELADDSSVVVLVENTSNLKEMTWVHCIDRTLAAIGEDELKDFQPELLITLGGAIISKRIKKFLRESNLQAHWKVGFEFPEMNTYRALSDVIQCEATDFLKWMVKQDLVRNRTTFGAKWKQRDFQIQQRLEGYWTDRSYSDLTVFELLLDYVPEGSNLHMANSSVVRYCQLFDPILSINYFANRGTSGIDGSTSTACGVALMSEKCNVLITGDISFFYDSNALWSNHLSGNLRIFLINNSGGGIFRIIDGPSSTGAIEKYFEAKHDTRAEHLCKAFDVDYFSAKSLNDIESNMEAFYRQDGDRPKLMEIFTPNELNPQVLKEYFGFIGQGNY